jgi:hypothetical protein
MRGLSSRPSSPTEEFLIWHPRRFCCAGLGDGGDVGHDGDGEEHGRPAAVAAPGAGAPRDEAEKHSAWERAVRVGARVAETRPCEDDLGKE